LSDSTAATAPVAEHECAEHECLVLLEHEKGRLVNVSLEILGQARRMADLRGDEVVGLILGEHTKDLAREALAYGADRALCANSPLLAQYTSDGHAHVVGEILAQRRPNIVLFGATHNGRDVAGRLAVRLRTGLTADVTALEVEPESGLLIGEVPGFGGGILALVKCPERRPQMATVRPGIFEALEPGEPRGEIEPVTVTLTADMIRSEVLEVEEVERIDLTRAPVIVAVGGGAGGDLEPIERLAELLGGAVGATRVAVDNGWISRDHQIGQTGVSVRPKVCVCAGISGAVQFTCGVAGAETVIAIDSDPQAAMFDHADYGVVGDLFEVLNAVNKLLAEEESVASDGHEIPQAGTGGETEKGAVRATSAGLDT